MKSWRLAAVLTCAASISSAAQAECTPGAYASGSGDFVIVVPHPRLPPPAYRYMFLDGRRGSTTDPGAPVKCVPGAALVDTGGGRVAHWPSVPMSITDTSFSSVATKLVAQLIEPAGPADPKRPLVVMVHGSERTSALGSTYVYALAAQGIAVFAYDKRGTGASEGEYTQNFELLAADAAAALAHARTLARGRFGRSGYFGGSQGGWVAPLAASRVRADFVAVGFGLITSPIDEDREQMITEARALGVDDDGLALVNRLSQATASLLLSRFTRGYEDLAKIRREAASNPWLQRIHGEYSGEMLSLSEDELRRVGLARFDNLELIWNYDAIATLRKLDAPVLWVLAGEDREAPIDTTRAALLQLARAGKPVDIYLFPETDHGMMEFVTNADGSRTATRITDGYLRLLGDWIKGKHGAPYGRAQRLNDRR